MVDNRGGSHHIPPCNTSGLVFFLVGAAAPTFSVYACLPPPSLTWLPPAGQKERGSRPSLLLMLAHVVRY